MLVDLNPLPGDDEVLGAQESRVRVQGIHARDRLVNPRALKAVSILRNSHTFQYQGAAIGIRLTLLILGRGQEVERRGRVDASARDPAAEWKSAH